MEKNLPYGRQNITQEDIDAVVQALQGEYLTQGETIDAFESAFASYIGCKYAVAVSNGTAALHLCALALEVGPGDKVLTTPITFAASSNCIRYCGGEVDFIDIDPKTYLIDLHKVRQKLQSSPLGSYKGIVPVDFAGRPVNLEEIRELAREFNLWIIEDACHAPGGYFMDKNVQKQFCGNGNFADLAIFSFHPVKHIATGEGGMITTNDELLYRKLLKLRTHGITKNKAYFTQPPSYAAMQEGIEEYPGWYMEMQDLGFNYRITDFQCALGISQLKRADAGLQRRREIAALYANAFDGKPYILGQSGDVEGHAYHLYIIEVTDRLGLYNYLKTKKIYCQIHYVPTHMMPYYRDIGWELGDMPLSEKYYSHCLSLPMYPGLDNDDVNRVIDEIDLYFKLFNQNGTK